MEDLERLGGALHGGRLQGRIVEDPLRQAERPLVHHHAVDRGEALQAAGQVGRGPGHESLAGGGVDANVNERLARRHAAADVQGLLPEARQSGRCAADRKSGPDGPLGVVLVDDRDAEDREHGVPDELLHHAAELLDDRPRRAVVEQEDVGDVLGVEPLARGGRADEVA